MPPTMMATMMGYGLFLIYISILNEYFEYLLERICLHSLFLFDGQVGGMFVAEDEVQEHPRYIKMTVSLVVFSCLGL